MFFALYVVCCFEVVNVRLVYYNQTRRLYCRPRTYTSKHRANIYINSGVFVFGFLVLKASCGASRRSVSVICYALSERSAETKHRTGQALDGCETVRPAFKDGYPPHQPTLIKCARRRIYVKHLFPSVCWAIVYTVPMLIH